jgi:hypothetical protein
MQAMVLQFVACPTRLYYTKYIEKSGYAFMAWALVNMVGLYTGELIFGWASNSKRRAFALET